MEWILIVSLIWSFVSNDFVIGCDKKILELNNRTISADLSKAKLIDAVNTKIENAELDGKNAFCAKTEKGFFVQVNFSSVVTVSRLSIQGFELNNEPLMLNAFVLQFSIDGQRWYTYFDESRTSPKYFLVQIRAAGNPKQPIEFDLLERPIGHYMRLLPFWAQSSTDRKFCLRLQITTCDEVQRPQFKTARSINLGLHSQETLSCVAYGQMKMQLYWLGFNHTMVYGNSSSIISLQHDVTSPLILRAGIKDLNDYNCSQFNNFVNCTKSLSCIAAYMFNPSLSWTTKTLVQLDIELPEQLSVFVVKSKKHQSLTVSWKNPVLHSLKVSFLEYELECNTTGSLVKQIIPARLNYKSLRTDGLYKPLYCSLMLRLSNKSKQLFPYQLEQDSVKLHFRSLSARPNVKPTIKILMFSSTEIRISLQVDFDKVEYGKLNGYIIHTVLNKYGFRIPQLHNIKDTHRQHDLKDHKITSYVATGMRPWSEYNVSVVACNEDNLKSNISYVMVNTAEDKPETGPSLEIISPSSISASFQIEDFPYQYHNGKIISYLCFTVPGNMTNVFPSKKETDIFEIQNLKPYTDYFVKCKGETSAGYGPFGKLLKVTTKQEVPAKPKDISILPAKDTSDLLLRWSKPVPENGVITKYEIYIILVNGTERIFYALPDQNQIYDVRIPAGIVSRVKIRAYTEIGSGPWSVPVQVTATTTLPTPPTKNDNIAIITTFSVVIFIILLLVVLCFLYYRRRYPPVIIKDSILRGERSNSYADDTFLPHDGDYLLPASPQQDVHYDHPEPSSIKMVPITQAQAQPRSPIPVEEFANYMNRHKQDEYEKLLSEFKNDLMSGKCYPWQVADRAENKPKNRYTDIAAYDHSRIILHHDCKRKTSDYINANSFSSYDYETKVNTKYISTQGPTENVISDFWLMVWQENINVIVMLTNLKENDKAKCSQYWAREGSLKLVTLTVTLQKIDKTADYITRTFIVEKTTTKEQRTILQLHFVSWPDHGVPDYPTAILSLRRRVRHYIDGSKQPMLIHCSAGVGRSGCYILIDAMLERIDNEGTVDIFNFLRYMRTRRINMVQTFEQYVFAYTAILEYITFGNTEIVIGDLDKKTRELIRGTGMKDEFSILTRNTQPDTSIGNLYRILLREGKYVDAFKVDGYKQRESFILMRSPSEDNVADFWKMVLEKECHTIVMLNKCQENSEEYFKYWPEVDSHAVYRDIAVFMNSEVANGNIITRRIKITTNKVRCELHHFQYVDWPEKDVPNKRAYSNICTLMQAAEKSQQTLGNGPIIVHAGNDYGRSGAFISIYNSTERLKVEQLIDVLQCVRAIRIAQPLAVDNVTQYQFVYNMLRTYLEGFENYWNYKDYKVCRSPLGSTTSATS